MKILLLADFDIQGGTGTYFKRIIPYLSKKGSVHVVLSKFQADKETLSFLESNNVSFSRNLFFFPKIEHLIMRFFRKIKLLHWYQYLRDFAVMRRLSKSYHPDLYFISQGGGDRYFAFLKAKCCVIIVCHSLWMEDYSKKIAGLFFKKYISKGINIDNKRIVTVSNHAKDLFIKDLPQIYNNITTVIPNYAEVKNTSEVPLDYKIKANPIVLTFGHMTGYKNPSVWLKTASLVHRNYGNQVKFIWAGRPMEWDIFKEDFSKEVNTEFLGFVKNTTELYKNASVYFQPSIMESQGIAVIEALANGIPCVVSNVGGLPESITDGKEGFVRSPYSAEEFSKCIINLLSNDDLLKRMSLSAKNKYDSCFTKKSWQTKMDELFNFT